jgi:hypothetical protein
MGATKYLKLQITQTHFRPGSNPGRVHLEGRMEAGFTPTCALHWSYLRTHEFRLVLMVPPNVLTPPPQPVLHPHLHLSQPNYSLLIVNVCSAWLDERAPRAMRQKSKLSSDDGDARSKKCKWRCDGVYGGDWRSPVFGVSLESGSWFSVRACVRNLALVAVKKFPRLI